MKNQEQKNNSILTQQTNSVFQLWRQLKNSIFNVLFVLLNQSDDNEDQSIFGLTFQVGLDYLQMMAFPFNNAVIEVWNGGQTLSSFFSIFTNLSFSNYIPGVGFSTFLIMLYLLIFVIILVILDIIYVSYSFSKKKFAFTWPLEFLAKVVPLCVTVFFLPIMQTLLSVVSCQNSQQISGIQVMENFPDIICWQGWHMFHAVVTLFFTSIFVFISSIVALTIFQPRMTTNSLTARQNSSGEVIFIINKMICQFVFSFTPFDNTSVYCIMLFLLSGWLWVSYNVQQPFYNKNASKFFRICSTYYFWTNTMLMVSQLLIGYGFEGGLVVWMCGLPFIGISILFERKSNIQKLFSSNLKFRSGQQLESHLQYVLQLIHNREKDKNSYMLLLGYIEKHIEICLQDDCPLRVKRLKKQQELQEIEQNCQQLIKQLLRMYKQGVKKYPTCTRLRLSFAFFYMQHLANNNNAYQQFTIAQTTQPTFGEQFIIYRFKKIIRENLQLENQDEDNDLIEIIRFDNYVSLCEEAMLLSARLHKDFWAQLQEQTPDLKKLNQIGSQITQTTLTVKQNYKQVQKINSHVSQVIHNYAIYLIFVGQSHQQGKQLLQHAKRIYFQKKQSLQSDSMVLMMRNGQYSDLLSVEKSYSGVIKLNIEYQSLGKVIYVNQAFTQLTGYLKEDVNGRSLDKLLPEIFSANHQNAVKLWLADEEKKILSINNEYIKKPHSGFFRHKSGFIIPIDYRVSFNIEQNTFLAVLRPNQDSLIDMNSKIHVITNTNNVIKDISHLGFMCFGIDKESCINNEIVIEDLGLPRDVDREKLFSMNGVSFKFNPKLMQKKQGTYNGTFTSKTLQQHNIRFNMRKDSKTKHQQQNQQQMFQQNQHEGHQYFQQEQQQQDGYNQHQQQNQVIPKTNSQSNVQQYKSQQHQQQQPLIQYTIRAEQIYMPASEQYQQQLTVNNNNNNPNNNPQSTLRNNNKTKIGYIYTLQKQSTQQQPLTQKQQRNNQLQIFDDFITSMYEQDPRYLFQQVDDEQQRHRLKKSKILAEMLMEMNNGQKITFQSKKFRNYAQQLKIKTYRYFNHDYIRIYQIQYEQQSHQSTIQQSDSLASYLINTHIDRMNSVHYQQKIKQAINTEIVHKQVLCLRFVSIVYIMGLCLLSALAFGETVQELEKISSMIGDNYLHIKDVEFVTTGLQYTVNYQLANVMAEGFTEGSSNYHKIQPQNILPHLRQYRLVFDPDDYISCELEQSRTQQMALLQVMNLIQSRVISYFDKQSLTKDISIAYRNFLISVYQVNENHSIQSTITIHTILVLAVLTLIITLMMLILWIYYIMRLDQKQFDIMIWFLDIPIDYVIYLQTNCVRFIKNYTTIKQLEAKGISMDDKEHYCDQYQQKVVDEDEEIDEDNMTRKIMIAKHKKKTFISKFHCGYLSTLWLLIYCAVIPLLFILQVSYEKALFELINQQWLLISKEYLWSSTFPIVLGLEQLGYDQFRNDIGHVNLTQFQHKLRGNFLNTLTKHNKVNDVKLLLDQVDDLAGVYAKVYYGDLCDVVGGRYNEIHSQQHGNFQSYDQYLKHCTLLLDHKLHAGLNTYFSLLTNVNPVYLSSITHAHSTTTGPAMLLILTTWKNYFTNEINSFKSLSTILIYLYIAITIISFLSLWMIYLNKQNDKMNRTIQMLNMIPMGMIPKNRKDTREFIQWLIRMANKKKQSETN